MVATVPYSWLLPRFKGIFQHHRLFSVVADRNQNHFGLQDFFYSTNVLLRVGRKIGKSSDGRERRIPPIHLFQDGLSALHGSDAGGKLLVDLVIVAVGDAHGDFLEAGQYIKLRQREAGDAADPYRMAHSHRVKPATAAWPAGGGAELDPFTL